VSYGLLGVVYADRATLLSAGVIALYSGVLLSARTMLVRGRVVRAVMLTSIGLLVAALLLTAAHPALWLSYAVVPMLSAALLLQYAPSLKVNRAIAACGVATAGIVALGETLPHITTLQPLFVSILRGTSLIMTIAFVLFLLWQFRQRLQETLTDVQAMNAELTARNAELVAVNDQFQTQVATSQRLIEQITALETPVTLLADAVLFAPIFGHISTHRAEQISSKLLTAVYDLHPRWIIIDIQGVPHIDTQVARRLISIFQAVRLLGCQICVCGMTADVALVMTQHELSFGDVVIVRDPQEALAVTSDARDALTPLVRPQPGHIRP
jgi:anti-anti-sigma regulatory factor